MVRFKNSYFVKHYLPYLLNPKVDFGDIDRIDYKDEIERMKFLEDEVEYDRIEFPIEAWREIAKDELRESDIEELIKAGFYNEKIYSALKEDYPEELLETIEDLLLVADDDDTIRKILSDPTNEWYEDVKEAYEVLKKYKEDSLNNLLKRLFYDVIESIDVLDYYELQDFLDEINPDFFISIQDTLLGRATSYNYVYEPEKFDPSVALYLGMMPFYVYDDNRNKVAVLGGVASSDAPELDAYQILVDGTVRENSIILERPEYAKRILGERVFNEVMKVLNE